MREILFRAWDTINSRMIHDFFYLNSDGDVYYDQDPFGVDMSGKKRISPVKEGKLIIMQGTGLKDKNGTPIYEGDLLEIIDYDWNSPFITQVVWGNEYPAFCLKPSFSTEYNDLQHAVIVCKSTIIGNIYESPNLINKQ